MNTGNSKLEKDSSASNIPMVEMRDNDCSAGGCYLAAAELESSKQYLPQEDGSWVIAHSVRYLCIFYSLLSIYIIMNIDNHIQLPVSEDSLNCTLKIGEQASEQEDIKYVDFAYSGSRLWKVDVGPLRNISDKMVSSTLFI